MLASISNSNSNVFGIYAVFVLGEAFFFFSGCVWEQEREFSKREIFHMLTHNCPTAEWMNEWMNGVINSICHFNDEHWNVDSKTTHVRQSCMSVVHWIPASKSGIWFHVREVQRMQHLVWIKMLFFLSCKISGLCLVFLLLLLFVKFSLSGPRLLCATSRSLCQHNCYVIMKTNESHRMWGHT